MMMALEMLEYLKGSAIQYKRDDILKSVNRNGHMNDIDDGSKMDENDAVAVIVDFINYIGMKNCIDYALYSRDI